MKTANHAARARKVLDLEIGGLARVRNSLGAAFNAAVTLLLKRLNAGGKIVVTGVGKSLHIAQKISATFASTGATSVTLNPIQAMHGDLGILSEGDVLLVLSYSGESDELISLIPPVKRLNVPIIAITGDAKSTLARWSDAVICASVDREACPFNMAPTVSTTAALAIGDALAMVVLEARGFRKEDYAKLHPGGAIGRALLLRVADIMRTGRRIAVVKRGAAVKHAVLAMTSAKSGSAAVTDSRGRLLGIITDGDLRRHMTRDSGLLGRTVESIMTPSPVTVRPDHLAIDVLKVFEKKNIDDILVVDAARRVVGQIDIQDLPKLKIM